MSSAPGGRTDASNLPDSATVERCVSEIWREVLGPGASRPGATFFDLQGQSISAIRIVARIEDELGVVVDVAALFDDPDLPRFLTVVMKQSGHHG